MLTPNSNGKNSFVDVMRSSGGYWLSELHLDISTPTTAVFKAKLNGPAARPVWARAWLSTEAGTLAESASAELRAGDEVTLEVVLQTSQSPQYAYMRIESAPLNTEHAVRLLLA